MKLPETSSAFTVFTSSCTHSRTMATILAVCAGLRSGKSRPIASYNLSRDGVISIRRFTRFIVPVFCFVRAIALSISSVPVAAPAPGHELRRHLMTASSRAHEKTRRVRGSAPASYDEGHQIGNTPRLAGLQISDYDACSLDIPAASPNFGVARVLIEEQKTIRKIGI